jgi:GTP-binding protein HflX
LVRIDRQKSTQRMNRGKLVRVALVGYTNAGKSTLLNLLSKSHAVVEDKLFATLDTMVRKVVIKNLPFLLVDTVGFIHKLPHFLVESFKATLDEVREADLLLHVIDISHPDFEAQMQVVDATLKEIGAGNKPLFTVFNKIDAPRQGESSYGNPGDGGNHSNSGDNPGNMDVIPAPGLKGEVSIYISAREKTNIDILQQKLYARVREIHISRYPYTDFLY